MSRSRLLTLLGSAALVGAALGPLACDSDAGTCSPEPIGAVSCGGEAPTADNYPVGPFGTAEGGILEDLTFTDSEGNELTLSGLRAEGNKSLLLISTAAEWCAPCKEEQPELIELDERWEEAGLQILLAVFENQDFEPASVADASKWANTHGTTFPVVADTEGVFGDYYDKSSAPMNMFVDLCTMEILSIGVGFNPDSASASIESRLCTE